MSTKHAKWILPIGFLLGISCCILGFWAYGNWSSSYTKSHPEVKPPAKNLSIDVDIEQREKLFDQLQKFSEKHHLGFHLSLYSRETANDTFLAEMRRQNFLISAASKPINQTEIDFYFTVDDPTNPPSQETIDELYNDLKAFVIWIPSVKIAEEN